MGKGNFKIRDTRRKSDDNSSSIVGHIMDVNTGLDTKLVNIDDLFEAPTEWNFYEALPPQKMQELIESIATLGLQEPVIVWNRDNDGHYMILSGHNRVRAFKKLKEIFNDSKYDKIHAIIKDSIIGEEGAKEIIVDTNWVQRVLTPMQKAKSIMFKYNKHKLDSREKKIRMDINEKIAEEYSVTKRQIIDYKSLSNLSDKAQELMDNGSLIIKAGVQISKLTAESQDYIVENYSSALLNKNYNMIKKCVTEDNPKELDREKFKEVFCDKNEESTITITIPSEYKNEFINDIQSIIENYEGKLKIK